VIIPTLRGFRAVHTRFSVRTASSSSYVLKVLLNLPFFSVMDKMKE
jgi:hypothetical protein